MTANELCVHIRSVFPVEPMPRIYWIDRTEPADDIGKELASRIAYRPWPDVTLLDWAMAGLHASFARSYFDADAFRYYLPSLLIGGLNDLGYIDWPLEPILPAGRSRRTDREWWQRFQSCFSEQQTLAVRSYLILIRSILNDSADLHGLHLLDEAQVIWGSVR
jgi:hypothetical protein